MISGSDRRHQSKSSPALGALAVLMALSLVSLESHAQDQDAVKRATARELAVQAADAFDTGDYATALDHFTRAHALYPAPTLSIMQARALVALGRWVEGFEKYNETTRTPLGADASEPFRRAVTEASNEAQQLEVQLPRLELRTPETSGLSVQLDGKPLPAALLNLQHAIDPGAHRIAVEFEGSVYFEQTVDLVAQQTLVVEVPPPPGSSREPVVTPSNPTPARDTRSTEAPIEDTGRPAWLVPVSFTVGGLGAATAVTSLILASGPKSNLDAVCDPGCPPSATGDLDDFRLYRNLFFVGATIGVVGSALGVYFVLTEPDDSREITVGLTPGGVDLSGRF